MAFFKRVQKKVNDLWYPQSVTWGKAVTTREVADELSVLSTVTRGDTYAVMENLGRVLSNFMGQGRTVKINGEQFEAVSELDFYASMNLQPCEGRLKTRDRKSTRLNSSHSH